MQPQIKEAATLDQPDVRTEFERLLAEERHHSNGPIDDASPNR